MGFIIQILNDKYSVIFMRGKSMEFGRAPGHPERPPFRSHRAQFRQWAQDKIIHIGISKIESDKF
jgi:hypothetical protein